MTCTFSVELPGIETDALPGNITSEVPVVRPPKRNCRASGTTGFGRPFNARIDFARPVMMVTFSPQKCIVDTFLCSAAV
jgi:hypothetical protein